MSSDWMTGAFTLAGSIAGAGLTGTLTLATTKAQRWQTKAQLEAADAQRAQELRRDGYTRLIAAASTLMSVWKKVLDQQKAEITTEELTRGDPSVETARHLHGQIHGQRVELEQAVANVQLLGPSETARAAGKLRDRFQHLDDVSEEWFRARSDGKTENEVRYYQLHADQFGICVDTLDQFAAVARAALGLG